LVLWAAERERPLDRLQRLCSERQEELVVRQLLAVLGCHELPVRIDLSNGRTGEGRSRSLHELLEGKPPHLAEPEGGGDRKRPVDELLLGRDKLDGHPVAGELAESEGCFERGDAGTGNQDVQRTLLHSRSVRAG